MVKGNGKGLIIGKPTALDEIDSWFDSLDEELKALFLVKKNKELELNNS